jgi:hypothetical protein
MTTAEIKTIVDQYKRGIDGSHLPVLTQRRRAELERMLWSLAGSEIRRANSKRKWLRDLLGGPLPDFDIRYTLLDEDEAAEPLWNRIENDNMSLWTAVKILRDARKDTKSSGIDIAVTISTRLAEFDKGRVFITPKGKLGRKRKLPPIRDAAARKSRKIPTDDRSFWPALKASIVDFVAKKLVAVDPIVAERLYNDFDVALRVVFDEFQTKLNRKSVV